MFIHLVARALRGYKPMADPESAWWLMWRLRLDFPLALAACLMPDHLHLIIATLDPTRVRTRMTRVLAQLTVRLGLTHLFEPVPTPEIIPNGRHLERLLRYVWLNPCRAKLVGDPLAWPWSTYRGVLGAEVDPWVNAEAVATAIGRSRSGFASSLHTYVTGDPAVCVTGSALPALANACAVPSVPLQAVRSAALSATPWSAPWPRRRLIVQLGAHQGWRDVQALANASGLCPRSVRRALGREPDPAARLCLSDARLELAPGMVRPLSLRPRRWVPPLGAEEDAVAAVELV